MKKHLLPLLWVLCIFVFQSKDLKATKKTGTQNPKLNSQQFTKHDKDTKAARATIIYVDKDATTGGNNGTSWADAYTDLQTAITNAVSGNHIWVAAGTYKPTATASRDIYFEIPNGVELYGGFAGTETDTSQRMDYGAGGANETILSGDIGTEGDNTDNSYHVVYIDDASSTIKLNGLTISDGYAYGPNDVNDHRRDGGGLYFESYGGNTNTLFISNCIFSDNEGRFGGGIHQYAKDGAISTSISYCTFNNNSAEYSGGGIESINGGGYVVTASYNSCTFIANSAEKYGGGAVRNYSTIATFNDCSFTNNQATNAQWDQGGGAIHLFNGGTATLTSCVINNNSSSTDGGGIYVKAIAGHVILNITDCQIINNSATESGGGIYIWDYYDSGTIGHSTTINQTKIQGNTAGENGGGICGIQPYKSSDLSITNSLITGNKQNGNSDVYGGGGGIYSRTSSATHAFNLINTTISGNYATNNQSDGGGGGINLYGSAITANIKNTVIYDNYNINSFYDEMRYTACTPTFTNSIVDMGNNALTGTNITYLDPRFTDPIDAETEAPTTNGDFSLLAVSPLINAGTTADAPADDIDGNARPLPVGTMPDIGAYEYSQMETTAPSGSGTSSGDPYMISSLENLAWMQYQLWDMDKYYKLTTDIDASASADWNDGYGFRSIGKPGYYYDGGSNYNVSFSGTLYGVGSEISGLTINDPSADYQGFIGYCHEGEATNFGLTDIYVNGNSYTASLIGMAYNSSVSDVYATGIVSGTEYVGGLIGKANLPSSSSLSITDCYTEVDVTSTDSYTGGFIGYNIGYPISESYALGDVSSTGSVDIGGFIGYNYDNNSAITDCFYIGTVSASNAVSRVGGFVGRNYHGTASITRCYSVADVNTAGTNYGFCGSNEVDPGLYDCIWNGNLEPDGVGGTYNGDVLKKDTYQMKKESTYTDEKWDFVNIWTIHESNNNGYPYLQDSDAPAALITWTGNEGDQMWETVGNWDPKKVPDADDNVLIPNTNGKDPGINSTVASPANCNKLTIQPNAYLFIPSGGALTVNGILETEDERADAYLKIENGGSFILEGSANGNIEFKKYLSSGKYHYISSPVDYSSTAYAFDDLSLGLQNSDQFYRWEEDYSYNGNIGNWVDIWKGEDGSGGTSSLMDDEIFQKAKGYAISYNTSSETISLSGTPFDRSMSISMTRTENSTNEGWNLLGNPFTAALAANNIASATNLVSVNSANLSVDKAGIYVWDEEDNYEGNRNDYITISNLENERYIAPGQAFMVCAATNGASFEIEKGMQHHASATFYKSTDDIARYYLQVKGPEKDLNDILIGFLEGKTKGLDPSYDVAKVKGNPNIALYSYLIEDYNNQEFAHQALPAFEEDYAVKIGLDAWIAGAYALRTKEMQNIPEHIEIELLDKETGIRTNMRDVAEYTFYISNPESLTDRFVLTFKAATGIAEGQNTDLFSAYSVGSKIYIQNPEALSSDVRIMDISGKTIMKFELNANALQEIETNLHTGVYLIQIINGGYAYNKQLLLH